jgi:hypothetical protein
MVRQQHPLSGEGISSIFRHLTTRACTASSARRQAGRTHRPRHGGASSGRVPDGPTSIRIAGRETDWSRRPSNNLEDVSRDLLRYGARGTRHLSTSPATAARSGVDLRQREHRVARGSRLARQAGDRPRRAAKVERSTDAAAMRSQGSPSISYMEGLSLLMFPAPAGEE